jgi:FMN-dependent NADH-azoreductase
MKLLKIDSSARRNSVSRQLTAKYVEAWKVENPGGEVKERDLATTALPHITDDWAATYSDPTTLTPAQKHYLSTSDELIEELIATDTIVVGAPMYNFMISWELKAWIDQVVRVGKTMVYGASGTKGLLKGKKVVVLTSRGGSYSTEPSSGQFDFQESYLRRILGFIGLTDLTFIHAENQARRELSEPSRTSAFEKIGQVVSIAAHATENQPDKSISFKAESKSAFAGPQQKPNKEKKMQTLKPVDQNTASGKAKELLNAVEQRIKRIPNIARLMGNSPAVLDAYFHFNEALDATKITPKLRALITTTVSEINGCDYTLSDAYALGPREGLTEEDLTAARRAEAKDPKIAAALRFAAKVIGERGNVAPHEVEQLRSAGYSDEEIVDVIGVIALNLFRNYFNLVAGTEVDFPLVKAHRAA